MSTLKWERNFLYGCAAFALAIGWGALAVPVQGMMFCAVASDLIGLLCDAAMLYMVAKRWSRSIVQGNAGLQHQSGREHTVTTIHRMSKLILLTLFGMVSSFVVIVVLSSTHNNALIAGIMCCDEVINSICMALCFTWAEQYY